MKMSVPGIGLLPMVVLGDGRWSPLVPTHQVEIAAPPQSSPHAAQSFLALQSHKQLQTLLNHIARA